MVLPLFLLSYRISPLNEVESLLEKSRAAYQHLQSAKVTLNFTTAEPGGHAFAGKAVIHFQSPVKLNLEIDGRQGGKIKVITDGKTIWTSDLRGHKAESPYSLAKLGASHPLNLETICLFDSAHELNSADGMRGSKLTVAKDVAWNKKNWIVLREVNTRDDVTVQYFIDPATFLIWRVFGVERHARKVYVDTQIISFEVNPKIPEAFFTKL